MTYVQFYHETTYDNERRDWSGPPRLIEACGSDSVCIMDGRHNKQSMIAAGYKRADQLRYVAPYYKAFRLFQTDSLRNQGRPVSELIPIGRS